MYDDLKGQVAVITGASKGIGKAIAQRLVKEHMAVAFNYNSDKKDADEVVKSIENRGGKAIDVQGDVSNENDIHELMEVALKHFGKVNVWINNAGMETPAATHEMSLKNWQRVINVNLTGTFLGSREALRYFVKKRYKGRIINLSSVHDKIPWPTFAHYAASKGGINMFTKTIALEYAKYGIRVNNVSPGAINTPINAKKFTDPHQLADTKALIPMDRIGDPSDVSAAVAWLSSNQSKYVTGDTLYVDGGMTLYPSFEEGKG